MVVTIGRAGGTTLISWGELGDMSNTLTIPTKEECTLIAALSPGSVEYTDEDDPRGHVWDWTGGNDILCDDVLCDECKIQVIAHEPESAHHDSGSGGY